MFRFELLLHHKGGISAVIRRDVYWWAAMETAESGRPGSSLSLHRRVRRLIRGAPRCGCWPPRSTIISRTRTLHPFAVSKMLELLPHHFTAKRVPLRRAKTSADGRIWHYSDNIISKKTYIGRSNKKNWKQKKGIQNKIRRWAGGIWQQKYVKKFKSDKK